MLKPSRVKTKRKSKTAAAIARARTEAPGLILDNIIVTTYSTKHAKGSAITK